MGSTLTGTVDVYKRQGLLSLGILRHRHEAVQRKLPDVWKGNSRKLHPDNAQVIACSRILGQKTS